jgi:hypothetical protein
LYFFDEYSKLETANAYYLCKILNETIKQTNCVIHLVFVCDKNQCLPICNESPYFLSLKDWTENQYGKVKHFHLVMLKLQ